MWGKTNRTSGISIMAASFISALLLSVLCSLFYNLWIYETERLKAEEGGWQARILGEADADVLDSVQSYANVKKAVVNEELSDGQKIVIDIYFKNMRTVFTDMPQIAALTGLPEESVSYHYSLLNLYLIRGPEDSALRWVFPFALGIAAAACLSLILVIHNAFAVTMNTRVRQAGIFSSIGATPRQIRTSFLKEAAVLCAAPVLAGNLLGIFISMGVYAGINEKLADVAGRLVLPFAYHPLILILSLLASAVTVWISAWIPAKKISKMTPLEAIKNTETDLLKRKKSSRILSLLFGIEGELAENALRVQRKSMRTATLSLIFSFLAFSLMMCFLTITVISQRETYFERYQDAWDVMVSLKDTEINDFDEAGAVQELSGVKDAVVYQRAEAKRIVSKAEISEQMQQMGGFGHAPARQAFSVGDGWMVNAPLIIMDDNSFLEYCRQIGIKPRLDGAVIRNKIVDVTDKNFRKRRTFPYLKENGKTTVLRQDGNENITAEIPVLAYTGEVPNLREEYASSDFYELVHFIPVSVWEKIKMRIGGLKDDVSIRILAEGKAELTNLDAIGKEVSNLLGKKYEAEIENRIQEKINNDNMFDGMKAILGLFCVLLAMIGIGNVFSNTLGFVRQRRREFARYLSIGLTPAGMKKMFCVEALVIAGRPVLITLPVTVSAVVYFIKISYLEPELFIREAPFVPLLLFILAIFAFVAFAYYLGAGKLLKSSLTDALRDDLLM